MHRVQLAVLLVLAPLAGCIGGEEATAPAEPQTSTDPDSDRSFETVLADDECRSSCYEPTLATGPDGTVYATGAMAERIWISEDGGESWTTSELPPIPAEIEQARRGDGILYVDPEDRVWYTSLVSESRRHHGTGTYAFVTHGIQIAVSEDGGDSWSTNTFVSGFGDGQAAANQADRQWLAVGEDGLAYLVYQHNPVTATMGAGVAGAGAFHQTGLWAAVSTDGGETFSQPQRIKPSEAEGYSAIGSPVVSDDGDLLLPATRYPMDSDRASVYPPGSPAQERISGSHGTEVWRVGEDLSLQEHTVLGTEGPHRAIYFAVLEALEDGYGLAWNDGQGGIQTAVSSDGSDWTAPVEVTGENRSATRSPWLVSHGDEIDVVFAEPTASNRSQLWTQRLTVEDGRLVLGEAEAVADGPRGFGDNALNSEFVHAAALSGQRLATAYASGPDDGTLFVSVER